MLGGRRVTRSHYRPDPWRGPEWIVAGCGITTAVLLYASTRYSAAALNPSFSPLHFPALPVVPTIAILFAAVAGFAAPPPRHPHRPDSRDHASRRSEGADGAAGTVEPDPARAPVPA
jgi:energy-coupling factor transport system permease protein